MNTVFDRLLNRYRQASISSAEVSKVGNLPANTEAELAGKQDIPAEGEFVDGDKTKLDGIEENATADQSDAEIKTAYENNADTNAYTDSEKSKVGNLPADTEEELAGKAPVFALNDVDTNTAKLALTEIEAGYKVRVTGEANRIEQFLGGEINDDDNWLIVGPNTVELFAENMDGLTVNGVELTSNAETLVGWVEVGQQIPYDYPDGPPPQTPTVFVNGLEANPTEQGAAVELGTSVREYLMIPFPVPPRAKITFYQY